MKRSIAALLCKTISIVFLCAGIIFVIYMATEFGDYGMPPALLIFAGVAFSSLILYTFGVIADNTNRMVYTLNKLANQSNNNPATQKPYNAPTVAAPQSAPATVGVPTNVQPIQGEPTVPDWFCAKCGQKNEGKSKFCKSCGYQK